jgi:putative endonuclease
MSWIESAAAEIRRPGVRITSGAPLFPLPNFDQADMFTVYVLRSLTTGRLYTGYTSALEWRLAQHNHGTTKSIKDRGPWELLYQEKFDTRSEAMQRERILKTGKGREELKILLAKNKADK